MKTPTFLRAQTAPPGQCHHRLSVSLCSCSLYAVVVRWNSGEAWVVPQPNFDNTLQAMLTLYITSSGEGWPSVMFRAVDTTGEDRGPKRDNSPLAAYYFVVFVCVGGFFFLNLVRDAVCYGRRAVLCCVVLCCAVWCCRCPSLSPHCLCVCVCVSLFCVQFLGVVFDNFMRLKKEMDSFSVLTESQREWVAMQRKLANTRPERALPVPSGKWRRRAFWLVNSKGFDAFIMVAIVLNVAALAATHDEEPDELKLALHVVRAAVRIVSPAPPFPRLELTTC